MASARFVGALATAILALGAATAAPADDPPAATSVERLIEQLGHDDYYVREQAQAELARLGFEAFEALSAATFHEDFEISSRAKLLLRQMRVEWTTKDDPPDVRKMLAGYEALDRAGRLNCILVLADLPDHQGAAALCRLVRYEMSPVVSKEAALALLKHSGGRPPDAKLAETLRSALEAGRRPAARWLLTWTRWTEAPEAAGAEWTRWIDDERAVLQATPGDSDPAFIAALLRLQVQGLKHLGRTDEALGAMQRLIESEGTDPKLLDELVDWLLREKSFEQVEQLARRFPAPFDAEPTLAYAVAEAQAALGRPDEAERTAEKASRMNPDAEPASLLGHLRTAYRLRDRGRFDWAEREFRLTIDAAAPNPSFAVFARLGLSEMLHDQGKDEQAGQVLEGAVEAIEKIQPAPVEIGDRSPEEVAARMHYFFACHHAAKGDLARQREHLDKALESDEADLDVLIACHRLPDAEPEYRDRIRRLVGEAAAELLDFVANDPENSTWYNQYAWLTANTEGDLDKALEHSRRSLVLRPDTGAYYDTLAHVHFARGEYEEAVKAQTRAVELEPHSGLILKKMKVFQEKVEEQKRSEPAPD